MADFFQRVAEKILNDKFVAAVLVAACFFVYANALLNDFVWDDEEQVVNNAVIRDWSNLPLVFTSSTFYAGGAGLSGGFYRPLVTLSYFINYSIWGLNTFGYHLAQMVFHGANAILIFYLLKEIFENQKVKYGRIAAITAAMFFAVHPVNVESVAYAGSIGEVMYVFWILLALLFFAKSFKNNQISNLRYFWISFVFVFFGFLSKETAIIMLPLQIVYLLLFVKPSKSIYLKFITGFIFIAGAYSFLRFAAAKIAPVSAFHAPIHLAPLWQRVLTLPYEAVSYIGLIFFPKDLSISRHFVVASAGDTRFWGALIALLLIAAAISFYIFKTRSKVFSIFILWFGISLAPVLNIVPLDMTMAERWMYFPMAGFLGALSFAGAGAISRLSIKKQKISIIVLAIAIAALGARTIVRNSDWRNGMSLYSHDIVLARTVSPGGSFDLENNYGVELFRAGKIDEAGERFRKSIALQPNWATPQNNLGAVLEYQNDLEGALTQYRKAADMGYYLAYENTAGILMKLKRYAEAKKFLEDSLAKLPNNDNLQFRLAYLYAADNIGNDKNAKQKSINILSLILASNPRNQNALALYRAIVSGQKIEI